MKFYCITQVKAEASSSKQFNYLFCIVDFKHLGLSSHLCLARVRLDSFKEVYELLTPSKEAAVKRAISIIQGVGIRNFSIRRLEPPSRKCSWVLE